MYHWRGTLVQIVIALVLGSIAWKHAELGLYVVVSMTALGGSATTAAKLSSAVTSYGVGGTVFAGAPEGSSGRPPRIPPGVVGTLLVLAVALLAVFLHGCAGVGAVAQKTPACVQCAEQATCVLVESATGENVCAQAAELTPFVKQILASRKPDAGASSWVPFALKRPTDAGTD